MSSQARRPRRRYFLDVVAAYNRDELPRPAHSELDDPLENIITHPAVWARLNDSDTEDILMRLYIMRRSRMQ